MAVALAFHDRATTGKLVVSQFELLDQLRKGTDNARMDNPEQEPNVWPICWFLCLVGIGSVVIGGLLDNGRSEMPHPLLAIGLLLLVAAPFVLLAKKK